MMKPVTLEIDGLKLDGQLYLPDKGNAARYPTICVCHGIPSGNPPDPNDGGYPQLADGFSRHGFAVFIFNFRGTGYSQGNLDITGWGRDLTGVIDYLYPQPEVDQVHLSLLGFSGGAAVSINTAAQDKRVSAVVACASPAEFTFLGQSGSPSSLVDHFRSIGVIRDDDFPPSAEQWLNDFRQNSPIRYISGIAPRPLLLIQGNDDEVVEVSHAYRLYGRAGEPKDLVIIEGAGHRLRTNEMAMALAIDWLKTQSRD